MKQIKTAEEILLANVIGVNVEKLNSHHDFKPSVVIAMNAYAEQFIDAAAEEILVDDSEDTNRKIILKLKEHLK